MKPLPQFTDTIIVNQTPRQQLVFSLMLRYKDIVNSSCIEEFCQILNEELSKYDVKKSNLTSVITELPEGLLGKTITVNYQPGEATAQVLRGQVIQVLYRDTAYDMSTITRILEHPDMSEEQKSMLTMTAWEETKPKIYHRLVLNTENQGILIVPFVKGVSIEQE